LVSKGILRNPERGWTYQVIDGLGQGGMSNTYLVYSTHLKKLAVLKEIHADFEGKAKARELFQREARILQSLRHPGVPMFYDFFCSEDKYSLVMEMVHGLTLEQAQPRSISEAINWMLKTCEVLHYLHKRMVIHRDIKPANLILRQRDKSIVLIDYGAVKESGSQMGTRISTFGYGAPEQQLGQPCYQSDFYGLGTTLIYMLTRRFPGDFYRSRERRFQGLEDAGLPADLAQMVYTLTRYDPKERPVDIQAVIQLLTPFAA
jgi:serine/threonine protein kinase